MNKRIEKKKSKGNLSKRKTTIFSYLKKIITWQRVGVVAAIVVPFIVFFLQKNDPQPSSRSEIEELRDSIKTNIIAIEKSFHPDKISLEYDWAVTKDFMKIRDFQQAVLDYVAYWNIIDATPLLSSFNNRRVDDFNVILESSNDQMEYFWMLWDDVLQNMRDIDFVGSGFSVENYKLNVPMYEKSLDHIHQYTQHSEELRKRIKDISNKINVKHYGDSVRVKDVPPMVEALKLVDDFNHNVDLYKFVNHFLVFVIQQNNKYESAIRAYQLDVEKDSLISIINNTN